MRIIKLEIEILTITGRYKIVRQAVGLDKKKCRTIKQFKDYVIGICDLQNHYEIELDGFALASKDSIKMLREDRVYRLKSYAKKKVLKPQSLEQQLVSSSQEELEISKSSSEEQQSPVIQQAKIAKSKILQKAEKIIQKLPTKIKKPIVASQSSQSEQSSQSLIPVKKIKKQIINEKKPSKHILNQKAKQNTPQKVIKSKGKQIETKILEKKVSSSSEESESSSSLQNIPKKVEIKKNVNVVNPQKQVKASQIRPKITVKQQQKKQVFKKAIIQDSSESEPSQIQQRKPIKQSQKKIEVQKNVKSPKTQTFKLPPALRNKNTNQFDKHKQNQWLIVDKIKYKNWQDKGHATLCQPSNKIRFKIVELDQQKFIPVKSGWIVGQVNSIGEGGLVVMTNVEQEGKQFQKHFQIPEHNMDDLQIFRLFATKEQLEFLLDDNSKKPEVAQIQQQIPQPNEKQNQQGQKTNNSVEKFICGQINYYFSDKNYLTDFFMQLHANADPQKYIKLAFMLNFPKIKKVLINQQKLFKYLQQDEKYDSRTYEIDFERKLIRKRGIFDPKKLNSDPNEKKEQQQNHQQIPPQFAEH